MAQFHPQAIEASLVEQVLLRKAGWPLFGVPKPRQKFLELVGVERCPAESSISRIRQRHGLSQPPRRRWVGDGGLREALPEAQKQLFQSSPLSLTLQRESVTQVLTTMCYRWSGTYNAPPFA